MKKGYSCQDCEKSFKTYQELLDHDCEENGEEDDK